MSNQFEVIAESRADQGKGASRRLRHANKVPAIIYGGGQEPTSLLLDHFAISKLLHNEAFYSHILTVKVDGKAQKAVLKDVQRHPYKPIIMHMDFLRITGKEKLHMNIPVHFLNEDKAPGAVEQGGTIFHSLHHIEVVCSPADLPEYIEVDLGSLKLNEKIHLSEVKLPKGVESVALQHGDDAIVVAIHMPKIVEEEEPVAEEAAEETPAEGAEGETAAEGEGEAEPKAE
jgi:large subunit ribosomal protein L25